MKLESKPSNVRLPIELKNRLAQIAQSNGLSVSDVIRLMLLIEIPEVEAGRFKLKGEMPWRT